MRNGNNRKYYRIIFTRNFFILTQMFNNSKHKFRLPNSYVSFNQPWSNYEIIIHPHTKTLNWIFPPSLSYTNMTLPPIPPPPRQTLSPHFNIKREAIIPKNLFQFYSHFIANPSFDCGSLSRGALHPPVKPNPLVDHPPAGLTKPFFNIGLIA